MSWKNVSVNQSYLCTSGEQSIKELVAAMAAAAACWTEELLCRRPWSTILFQWGTDDFS
jgi:hypothetical protein